MLDVYRIERQYTSYRFYLFLLAATLIGSSLSLLFFRIVGIARVDHLGFLVSDLTVAVTCAVATAGCSIASTAHYARIIIPAYSGTGRVITYAWPCGRAPLFLVKKRDNLVRHVPRHMGRHVGAPDSLRTIDRRRFPSPRIGKHDGRSSRRCHTIRQRKRHQRADWTAARLGRHRNRSGNHPRLHSRQRLCQQRRQRLDGCHRNRNLPRFCDYGALRNNQQSSTYHERRRNLTNAHPQKK